MAFSFFTACTPGVQTEQKTSNEVAEVSDPLPSWNDGNNKSAIVKFVEDVTNAESENFIPVSDRIATFDNDGTLWSEQPAYFQILFVMDKVKEMSADHPEWKTKQPFKAILENDMEALGASGMKGLMQLVMATHAGNTSEEFAKEVTTWITTAKHPTKEKPYSALVYQPMLELLDYLRANDFKTYIVSGGGVDFMRTIVTEVYGIPSEQIIGSTIKTEFDYNNGNPVIRRLPEIDFIDDKEGKPININKIIGKKPVFCGGNSDGDLQMMQWTASNSYKSLKLYIHHTDADREWAYDRESHIGRFDKALDEANEKGWNVVNMKEEWKVVFPFEM
jgi:hypothetical protein